MPNTIQHAVQRAAMTIVLAAASLCLSVAILRADVGLASLDELTPAKTGHLQCRIYFGCLPNIAKESDHVGRN
jgi:hypothetical protein